VDLPPRDAIYNILGTCLNEMISKGVVKHVVCPFTPLSDINRIDSIVFDFQTVPTLQQALMCEMGGKAHREHDPSIVDDRAKSVALRLISLSVLCRVSTASSLPRRLAEMLGCLQEHGMSGRALRRLPVLALARYIGLGSTASSSGPPVASGMQSGIGVSRTSSTAVDPAGGKKDAALKNLLGGAADVQVWLDRMEKVIMDSSEEVGRFS
jgi:pachytene checkpoint protein 2